MCACVADMTEAEHPVFEQFDIVEPEMLDHCDFFGAFLQIPEHLR